MFSSQFSYDMWQATNTMWNYYGASFLTRLKKICVVLMRVYISKLTEMKSSNR